MRPFRLLTIIVLLSFAEVATTAYLASHFGVALTFSVFAVPTVIGLAIQATRWHAMTAAWATMNACLAKAARTRNRRKRLAMPGEFLSAQSEVMLYWGTMVLLLIPGPITALVAYLLIMRRTRERVGRFIMATA